ncbi:hypothetical protein [Adhaeretor mobilis]|uniref:PEP-CTERM protein-sorting domain-containing protein n=1 Tax=Adhaeretor mobilis TaxID=1930276 RepID=A0A517MPW5_9BACT|nr:hypothetical protein [Adhaeretor mobilis]QDS96921.1 hypothetical protein HG15A2_01800 [Adhaeretor mobilis]
MKKLSQRCLSLACIVALGVSPAFGLSFVPNNDSPADWNTTADWVDLGGIPYAAPPGGSSSDDVKIGRVIGGGSGVVGAGDDVVINLNGVAGSSNQIGVLEIATYNDLSPPPGLTATLNIQGTGVSTLMVGGNTQLGRQGSGVATLHQSGGSVDFTGGIFAPSGLDTLAEFSGGIATMRRVFLGATTGQVAAGAGTSNKLLVSGGELTLGISSASDVSDLKLFAGSSLDISGGSVTAVYNLARSEPYQILDRSPTSGADKASINITGGVLTGIDRFSGPTVTNSGGTLILGDGVLSGTSDRTLFEFSNATGAQSSYTQTGTGKVVFPVLSNGETTQLRMNDSSTIDLSGGIVEVDFSNYTPSLGENFNLIQPNGSTQPTVSAANVAPAPAGFDWDYSRWGVDSGGGFEYILELIEGATGQPGDFTGEGDVDGADFLAWQRGEASNPPSAGDLQLFQDNYGTVASGAASVSQVPEPTSAVMLLMGMMLLGNRSSKKS